MKDKLAKAKKRIGQFGISQSIDPQGRAGTAAKLSVIDRKSLSKFLMYAETKYTK